MDRAGHNKPYNSRTADPMGSLLWDATKEKIKLCFDDNRIVGSRAS